MTFETHVKSLFDHYHNSVKTRPDLYRNGDHLITVVLPKELLDWSNAAAGHSGFGAGARAVGIRRSVADSRRALKEIFATPESLADFIRKSECDGPAHVEAVRLRHAERSQPKQILARDGFWSKYTKEDLADIKRRHKDHSQLSADYNTMTLDAFEERYLLDKAMA